MSNQRLLFVFLFVAGILGNILVTQAQQLTPECYVEMESDKYIVHFTLPTYTLEDENGNDSINYGEADACGTFTEIIMEDEVEYDITDVPGYPELPFFSLNLIIPSCATNVSAYMQSSTTENDYPPYYISPARKGSVINANSGSTDLDNGCFDSTYYYNGYTNEYPYGFCTSYYSVSNIYAPLDAAHGITFSIFPFSYHPEQGYMEVLQEAIFVIEFNCGDLISTMEDYQNPSDYKTLATALYFDSFNDTEIYPNMASNGSLLIIAAHSNMEMSLEPYVEYKQSQNYDVEVIYLNEWGGCGDSTRIKNLIYYNNVMPNPDFVLLVGNLDDIPPSHGTNNMLLPYSDDWYHPMVGRWIIGEAWDLLGNYADLRHIIDKTIETETDYVYTYSIASLFSGTDSKKRVSKRFYRNVRRIANWWLSWMGVQCYLHDGRTYANSSQAEWIMKNQINSYNRFFIYRGHGYHSNYSSAIASPYWLYASEISSAGNGLVGPMGFGFACGLNTYETDYSFGARWVASENAGGPTFYGATPSSYRSPNDCLAKRTFRKLRQITNRIDNFPISLWLKLSEYSYYWSFPTFMRGIEIDTYNLIGDPTLAVYGMDGGCFAPFHAPRNEKIQQENANNTHHTIAETRVYDINGGLVTTIIGAIDVEELPLSTGVHIVKTIYTDDTFTIEKIIK